MNQPAIQITSVTKQFGGTRAVNDVSLDIGSGEFFSLLGPSGCGKTTLLRMIAGFEHPTSGRITVAGADMSGVPPHKRPVNMVFQSYALFPHLSVFDNVAFGLRSAGISNKEQLRQRVKEALDLVRLGAFVDRFPSQLSGGQQQRVALARAAVNRPAVLLLDEPLSALDSKIRQEMQEELARLQKELQMTFVMVTHDQGEALALSNRIAVFYQGNLEQLGSPDEIYGNPRTAFVADFIGQTNLFEAVVLERRDPYLCVGIAEGLRLWVRAGAEVAVAVGRPVKAWMRTDALKLSLARQEIPQSNEGTIPLNCFEATVVSGSYQGTTTEYRLCRSDKLSFRVSSPSTCETRFSQGQTVTVSFLADAASVLPSPEDPGEVSSLSEIAEQGAAATKGGAGKLTQTGQIGRRQFLATTIGALLGSGAVTACSRQSASRSSEKELHLYSWADYLHPDTIPEFERRYGVKVIYDTFASNEALLAKMQAGASNYDIIVPTSYMVKHLKKMKLLAPIDKSRLKHFDNIMPRFRNTNFDPGCKYSLPYTWGTTGIALNKAAFAGRAVPDDWDVFWDARLAGRITLLDDARETIGMALKHRGYSINTIAEQPLRQACADLITEKPLVMSYTSDQVILQLASGDCLSSLLYSGDAYQAARENANVEYIVPRSGCSYWTDNLCIPVSAPNPDNAYLWMNFILEPRISAAIANYTRYATPNSLALKLISPELLHDKNLYPDEETMAKCEEVADIGSSIYLYDRLWTELKCA